MISAADSQGLARILLSAAVADQCRRLYFSVDPSAMTARIDPMGSEPVPLLTGHGDYQDLGALMHSYHQWGSPIRIGLIHSDGFTQFWVEKDQD
jgi:hypothetical protein